MTVSGIGPMGPEARKLSYLIDRLINYEQPLVSFFGFFLVLCEQWHPFSLSPAPSRKFGTDFSRPLPTDPSHLRESVSKQTKICYHSGMFLKIWIKPSCQDILSKSNSHLFWVDPLFHLQSSAKTKGNTNTHINTPGTNTHKRTTTGNVWTLTAKCVLNETYFAAAAGRQWLP